MLKIKKARTFARTVKASLPSDVVDQVEKVSFIARFRALKRAEIEALQTPAAKVQEKAVSDLLSAEVPAIDSDAVNSLAEKIVAAIAECKEKGGDRAFLAKILAGIEGATDEEGEPVSPDVARDAVIEDLTLCAATVEEFNASMRQAKAGN